MATKKEQQGPGTGNVSTGSSGKYDPLNHQTAKETGFATPTDVQNAQARVAAFGQIHPRE